VNAPAPPAPRLPLPPRPRTCTHLALLSLSRLTPQRSMCLFRVYGSGMANLLNPGLLLDHFGRKEDVNAQGLVLFGACVCVRCCVRRRGR